MIWRYRYKNPKTILTKMTKTTLEVWKVVIIYCILEFFKPKRAQSQWRLLQLLQLLQLVLQRDFYVFRYKKGLNIAIFPIFAPAKSGEIDLARESAFFALFLACESGQFIWITRNIGLMNAFAVTSVFFLHNINGGAWPYPLFCYSWESRPNRLKIRIRLGGSALFAYLEHALWAWEQKRRQTSNHIKKWTKQQRNGTSWRLRSLWRQDCCCL